MIWIQGFSSPRPVPLSRLKPVCPIIYPWLKGRTNGFISSPRAVAQSEIHTAFSGIWTWVSKPISPNHNCYVNMLYMHLSLNSINTIDDSVDSVSTLFKLWSTYALALILSTIYKYSKPYNFIVDFVCVWNICNIKKYDYSFQT